ncbi:hypothetical protein ABZ705_24540 [Streptomyces sp. NPDC006984]|uniref:hypothetical protein n=1 Tax=Streptomyces sp. NPDC006984 TaxID=3155463 RepID=UPI0033FE3C5D
MSVKPNHLLHGGKESQTRWIRWLVFCSIRKIARGLPPNRPLLALKPKEFVPTSINWTDR